VQLQRRPDVLRVAAGGDPADLVQRGAPEHDIGTHAERRVEPVLSGADELVEDALRLGRAGRHEIAPVAVMLRGLYERDAVIAEVRQHLDEEVRLGNVICVKYHDVLATRALQCGVDIARLGVLTTGTSQVAHILDLAQ
jgi:hypothetical protein